MSIKRKSGDRWTVIAVRKDTGEAIPFQIGYWEDMSWAYQSQANKIARDYQEDGDNTTLIVVPGWDSYSAALNYNHQQKRVEVCGVKLILQAVTANLVTLPALFCNTISKKEHMISVDGKIYNRVPNTYEWEPCF